MKTHIIDGKNIATWIKNSVAEHVELLKKEHDITPGLAVMLIGEDPASSVYVRNKVRACKKLGIYSEKITYDATCTMEEVMGKLNELNNREDIHGILVQLPLPPQLDKQTILDSIKPEKDVDGFHPVSSGKLLRGDFHLVPCTPAGIMKMFDYLDYDVAGKEAVIIGRSDIVGKPMALLLLHSHATITVCHSRTKNLADVAKRADILVCALGQPGFVDASFVKPGAMVIDVGTSRIAREQAWPELLEEDSVWATSFEKNGYALVGDVKYQQLMGIAEYVTPVPGGIGPLTIAMLMHNTLVAAQNAVKH